MATIRVGKGEAQEDLIVHEDIISRSDFFKRALNGNWAEAETRVIEMPEDDPAAVRLYLNFVYTKATAAQITSDNQTSFLREIKEQYCEVARVYVLAEKLQDTLTKNAMVRMMSELTFKRDKNERRYFPSYESISIVYNETPEKNLMRQLLVDFWTSVDVPVVAQSYDMLPKEFMRDLLVVLLKENQKRGNNARVNDVEKYLEQV